MNQRRRTRSTIIAAAPGHRRAGTNPDGRSGCHGRARVSHDCLPVLPHAGIAAAGAVDQHRHPRTGEPARHNPWTARLPKTASWSSSTCSTAMCWPTRGSTVPAHGTTWTCGSRPNAPATTTRTPRRPPRPHDRDHPRTAPRHRARTTSSRRRRSGAMPRGRWRGHPGLPRRLPPRTPPKRSLSPTGPPTPIPPAALQRRHPRKLSRSSPSEDPASNLKAMPRRTPAIASEPYRKPRREAAPTWRVALADRPEVPAQISGPEPAFEDTTTRTVRVGV